MDDATESTRGINAPPAAAVAVSVAVSLPLWRAVLPGITYILHPALQPVHGTAALAYAAALVGTGLALTLPVLASARRLARGSAQLLAPLGLLILAALLFLFQLGSPL